MPIAVLVTMLISLAWLVCLIGAAGLAAIEVTGVPALVARVVLCVCAIAIAWSGTRWTAGLLRAWSASHREPVRGDFVGRVCVIRTGHVSLEFGQAELRAADGSSAVIQVRQTAGHTAERPLRRGDSAVVYDYESAAEIFWVAPIEGV
ncbi:hypothetical protein ACWDOP_14060 [Nocardia sp. NPDC003693]